MSELNELEQEFLAGRLPKDEYIRRMHELHRSLWDYAAFIEKKNVGSIVITAAGVLFTTRDGIKILCAGEDERAVPFEIMNFLDYEADEIGMIRKFLQKDSVVLDIGANIGWYSLNLSRDVSEGRIFAFEPVPQSFEYLNRNIALNGLTNVSTYNIGLGDRAGDLEFYYDPTLSAATSMAALYEDRQKSRITCPVKKLDDVVPGLTDRVDLIKCDVEGAELFVLCGATETLKKFRPVLFLEMLRKWAAKYGYHPNEIITLLSGIGYGCYSFGEGKLQRAGAIDEATVATNFCFLHGSRHRALIQKLEKI